MQQPNFERRILVASLLSAAVIVIYAPLIQRRPPAATAATRQAATAQTNSISAPTAPSQRAQLSLDEDVLTLESEWLSVSVGASSGAIRAVTIRSFKNHDGSELRIGNGAPIFAFIDDHNTSGWILESRSATEASFTRTMDINSERLSIQLSDARPIVDVLLKSTAMPQHQIPGKAAIASWMKSDALSGRNNLLELVLKTERNGQFQREYLTYHEGIKTESRVPRGTSVATISERHFCQSIKSQDGAIVNVTRIPSEQGSIAISLMPSEPVVSAGEQIQKYALYFGPRDPLKMKEAEFSGAFPLGMLGQIGLILVIMLKGIAGVVRNYGVAVILLAGFVTTMLSPFTLMSFRSMRKMQALQPKIDQLKKKFANDPQRMNKETMALFKEQKVSPLGGCLPMLIQMPVFFALWSAISHVIELRGAGFLWIKDLSLPDRLVTLPFGFDLNILPIVIAILMFLQSRLSQKSSGAVTKEMALMSGPLMSVLFGVMFYQVPSSLALYWATNSLVSLGIWKLAVRI